MTSNQLALAPKPNWLLENKDGLYLKRKLKICSKSHSSHPRILGLASTTVRIVVANESEAQNDSNLCPPLPLRTVRHKSLRGKRMIQWQS